MQVMQKNSLISSWLEKIMLKIFIYHKSCAENISLFFLKKYAKIMCINYKIQNYTLKEKAFQKKETYVLSEIARYETS